MQTTATADRDDRTLRFLVEAAHAYAIVAPAVSRAMMVRMRSLAAATDVEIHQNIRQRFCAKCSQIYVPGSNCYVSIGQPVKKKRRARKSEAQVLVGPKTVSIGPKIRETKIVVWFFLRFLM